MTIYFSSKNLSVFRFQKVSNFLFHYPGVYYGSFIYAGVYYGSFIYPGVYYGSCTYIQEYITVVVRINNVTYNIYLFCFIIQEYIT